MRDTYIICTVIGLLLLLLSVFGELLEGAIHGFEALCNLDCFNIDIGFVPFSGVAICFGLVVFGCVGIMSDNIVMSGILGYGSAMIIQTALKKLKKDDSEAISRESLYLCKGKIINAILPNGIGKVEFEHPKGGCLTYPCKYIDKETKIAQGTEVMLEKFDGELAIVKLADEFAKYSDKN